MIDYEVRAETALDLLDEVGLGSHRAIKIIADVLRAAVRDVLTAERERWAGAVRTEGVVQHGLLFVGPHDRVAIAPALDGIAPLPFADGQRVTLLVVPGVGP